MSDNTNKGELFMKIEALQDERDALASKLNAVASVFPLTCRTACEGILLYPMEQYNKVVSALNAEPKHHLAAHDAEVAAKAVKDFASAVYDTGELSVEEAEFVTLFSSEFVAENFSAKAKP